MKDDKKDIYIEKLESKIKQLKKLVIQDPLTEILNRRGIYKSLDSFDNMYRRYEINYFVSFVDIKNFKQINDTKGHLEGDKILKKMAETVEKNIRKSDAVGRVGGDEFMVIFCAPIKDDMDLISQKLFKIVEDECAIKLTYATAKRSNFNNVENLIQELDIRLILKKNNDL